jgi:histone deacetylase complex regulatory component SIN3
MRKGGDVGVLGGVNNSKKKPQFDHACSYVSKIKQRFATEKDVYQKFLQVKESLTRALRAP